MPPELGQVTEQPEYNEAAAAADIAGILKRDRGEAEPTEQVEEVAQDAADEAPVDDENSITIDPEAPLFDVTVKTEGGANENLKVSLKELESGFMMQKDYQRKTAELARAREQLTQEVQKMVEPERQSYVQNLQMLQQAVMSLAAPDLQNINWEQIASEDPAKYVQLTAKSQRVQQTLQHIQGQMQQAQQQAIQQQAEHCQRMLSDPVQGIPNWGPEVAKTVIQVGTDLGYSNEELAQVVDYRAIKALHEISEYRKLKAAKPAVEKKVTVAPKVLKPGAPADANALQAKQETELKQRLQRTGDVKDAQALLLAKMRRKR
jgi:hypothetical protein